MKKGGRKSTNVEDRTGYTPSMGGPRIRSYKNAANRQGKQHLSDYKAVKAHPEVSNKMEEELQRIRKRNQNKTRFE